VDVSYVLEHGMNAYNHPAVMDRASEEPILNSNLPELPIYVDYWCRHGGDTKRWVARLSRRCIRALLPPNSTGLFAYLELKITNTCEQCRPYLDEMQLYRRPGWAEG
jgi:hypothetical protein